MEAKELENYQQLRFSVYISCDLSLAAYETV